MTHDDRETFQHLLIARSSDDVDIDAAITALDPELTRLRPARTSFRGSPAKGDVESVVMRVRYLASTFRHKVCSQLIELGRRLSRTGGTEATTPSLT